MKDSTGKQSDAWKTVSEQDGIEWLQKLPTIPYDGMTVTELVVGIRGGHEVVSIANIWKDANGRKDISQQYFEAGEITGFQVSERPGNA